MALQRLRLEIDASPAYEFVLSMAAVTAGRANQAPPELVTEIGAFAGGCDMVWARLLTVAYDTTPPRDPGNLIKQVQTMHPRELRLRLLGYYVRYFRRATPPDVIADAADGDAGARRRFIETSYPEDARWQSALAALLPLTAWDTRRRLLGALRRWEKVFAHQYDPGRLLAEAAARRGPGR